jgi:hypothetical protein
VTELRHTIFSDDPKRLALQLGENAQDANEALREVIRGRVVRVIGYLASGATTSTITLPVETSHTSYGVLLVRAYAASNPGVDIPAQGRLNFSQPDSTTLKVFEPSGLTTNIYYDLTFLILEATGTPTPAPTYDGQAQRFAAGVSL